MHYVHIDLIIKKQTHKLRALININITHTEHVEAITAMPDSR